MKSQKEKNIDDIEKGKDEDRRKKREETEEQKPVSRILLFISSNITAV